MSHPNGIHVFQAVDLADPSAQNLGRDGSVSFFQGAPKKIGVPLGVPLKRPKKWGTNSKKRQTHMFTIISKTVTGNDDASRC